MSRIAITVLIFCFHVQLIAQWDTIDNRVVRASASSTELPGFLLGFKMLGHFYSQYHIPRVATYRISTGWSYYEESVYAGSEVFLYPINSTRYRDRRVFVKIDKKPLFLQTNNATATNSFGPHIGYRFLYNADTRNSGGIIEVDGQLYEMRRNTFHEYSFGFSLLRRKGMTAMVASELQSDPEHLKVESVWYNFFYWNVYADVIITQFNTAWVKPHIDTAFVQTKWNADDLNRHLVGFRLAWEMQLQLHKKTKTGMNFWCFTGHVSFQYRAKGQTDLFIIPGIAYAHRSKRYLNAAIRKDQRIRIKPQK